MSNQDKRENRCPNCGRWHAAGEYLRHHEPGRRDYFRPADVECPCGALLRYTVPFFYTGNGWKWRIVRPAGN